MSFLQELGKGFIRSAVNQVGRDGGKVISNAIYGDAHATPIRRVGQSTSGTYFDTETSQQLTPQQLLQYATTDGWKPEYTSYPWVIRICLMFIAIFIGAILAPWSLALPLLPLYVAYRGAKHFFARHTTYCKMTQVPRMVSDRRYKGQIRQDGTETVKATILLSSTSEDKTRHTIVGISHILYAVIMWIGAYMFFMSYPLWTSQDISTSNDTIYVQQ